jgi:hypothetical protein
MLVMLPLGGFADASKCGTWKTVELALGWHITSLPLAGSGHAADARTAIKNRAERINVLFGEQREEYFMEMGPRETGIVERYDSGGMQL